MTDKNILNDIENAKKKQKFPILGFVVSLISILYGEFVVRVDGYFLAHTEPYLRGLPEDLIGIVLLVAGVIKLMGVLSNNHKWKRTGIVSLSIIWSGLSVIAATYSFGTGFPHPSWLFMAFVTTICVIESFQGRYAD